jgi:NAD(P)-dependent dehydrogenase (short-subunit alcohol dehydrogenase family)
MTRVALVTGGTRGIGAGIAKALAEAGHKVVANYAGNREKAEAFRAETGIAVFQWDVGDEAACAEGVKRVAAEVGPVDILVNNSGVSTTQRLVDVTPVDFDFVLDTNVKGAFFVANEVARRMIARAKGQADFRGRIVNIASVAGLRVVPQIGLYCISKAAVVQMTRAQALEWGRYGINVNALCPGYIRTEINDAHWDTESGRKLMQMLPRRRIGDPSDLDGALLLLVADESQFINGAVLTADDGLSVQ